MSATPPNTPPPTLEPARANLAASCKWSLCGAVDVIRVDPTGTRRRPPVPMYFCQHPTNPARGRAPCLLLMRRDDAPAGAPCRRFAWWSGHEAIRHGTAGEG